MSECRCATDDEHLADYGMHTTYCPVGMEHRIVLLEMRLLDRKRIELAHIQDLKDLARIAEERFK